MKFVSLLFTLFTFTFASREIPISRSLPHYVCTSYLRDKTVDFYGYGKQHAFVFPKTWSLLEQDGYCNDLCSPCEEYVLPKSNKKIMVGYGASCTLSFKEQQLLGLYNVTTNEVNNEVNNELNNELNNGGINKSIRLHETVNPFEISGIFESSEKHLFITNYILCVYKAYKPLQKIILN